MASCSYEPMPRYYHTSAPMANKKVVIYSGLTQDYTEQSRERLAYVEVFDPFSEKWEAKKCTGELPAAGVRRAASASFGDALFTYGGLDGADKFINSLHKLNGKIYDWSSCPQNAEGEVPMPKYGASMVACEHYLALLGGYGIPHSSIQSGSSFIKSEKVNDGRGWTNEFHIYHLNKGMHYMYNND